MYIIWLYYYCRESKPHYCSNFPHFDYAQLPYSGIRIRTACRYTCIYTCLHRYMYMYVMRLHWTALIDNLCIICAAYDHSCHILPFQPILWNRYLPPEPANTAKHSPKSISEGGRIWQVCYANFPHAYYAYLPYSTPLWNIFGAVFGCFCRLGRELSISQNWLKG